MVVVRFVFVWFSRVKGLFGIECLTIQVFHDYQIIEGLGIEQPLGACDATQFQGGGGRGSGSCCFLRSSSNIGHYPCQHMFLLRTKQNPPEKKKTNDGFKKETMYPSKNSCWLLVVVVVGDGCGDGGRRRRRRLLNC